MALTSPPPSVRVVLRLLNTPFFMLSYTFSQVLMKASSTPSAFFALASTYDRPFSSANAWASALSTCRLHCNSITLVSATKTGYCTHTSKITTSTQQIWRNLLGHHVSLVPY
jgi:hypothetical protein